jgi:hypothetical protein
MKIWGYTGEMLGSNLGRDIGYPEMFTVFLASSRYTTGQ